MYFKKFLTFILAAVSSPVNASSSSLSKKILCPYYADTFDQVFKPLGIHYLYDLYDSHPEFHETLDSYFRIKRIINPRKSTKVISYSLFWKPQQDVTIEKVFEKRRFKNKDTSFFEHFVKPIISNIEYFKSTEKRTTLRIYLAADLEFLIPYFDSSNVEIYLMESCSLGHSPGAMWRFLPLSDKSLNVVCMHDADDFENQRYIRKVNEWLNEPHTSGFYRLYNHKGKEDLNTVNYSPILAGRFGAKKWLVFDIEKAMKGYILHRMLFCDETRHPRDVAQGSHIWGFGNQFPDYGFDERFLKHVLYYYAANQRQLTLILMKSAQKDDLKDMIKGPCNYLAQKDFLYVYKRNPKAFYSN